MFRINISVIQHMIQIEAIHNYSQATCLREQQRMKTIDKEGNSSDYEEETEEDGDFFGSDTFSIAE